MPLIRDAVLADARSIAQVHVASWRAAYRGQLPDALLDGLSVDARERQWAAGLTDPQPRTAVLVADGGAGAVGFAAVGPARHGDDPALGELYAIYLDPGAWGTGVGRDLHAAALDRLRAAGFTAAVVRALRTNERALRFYRRAGWSDSGRAEVVTRPDGVVLDEVVLERGLAAR